jgi:hypothetical protein
LHDRVAAVRADLLEIAAPLQQVDEPDPACVAALRHLARDGISPCTTRPFISPSSTQRSTTSEQGSHIANQRGVQAPQFTAPLPPRRKRAARSRSR